MNLLKHMSTPPLGYNKLFKVFKIIATTVAILICGFFMIVFVSTYIFLSFEGKNPTAENKKSQDQAVTISKISKASATPDDQANFLDKASEKPIEPEKEVARDNRIKQGHLFFKEIVKLREDPRFEAAPPLCEIICHRSTWKKRPEGEESRDQFNSFLAKEGSRAFEDPKFRLIFELLNSHADLMMIVGTALEKIEPILSRKNELSELEKAYWSANAPILIAKVAAKFNEILPENRRRSKVIEELMKLRKQCSERSEDEIKELCQTL